MAYLIYAKRTGYKDASGTPVFDKTFRAVDSKGFRVISLADAMAYATRADAQEILDKPFPSELISKGLAQFEIRKAK